MKKLKLKVATVLFLLVALIASLSMAATENLTMSVISEPKATIKFGDNSYAERTLISKDLDKKELTFQIKVVNEEKGTKPSGELMLLIDNSKSMDELVDETTTRRQAILSSANTLITNLLKDNDNLKIGAISFSSSTNVSKEGTSDDTQLISDFTNDGTALQSKINNLQMTGERTDLDAGLQLAKQYLTKDGDTTDKSHKYLIVLSDGIPNLAIGQKEYFSDGVNATTKATLQSLTNIIDNNNIMILLTGITNPNSTPGSITVGDQTTNLTNKTYAEIIETIFGTTQNPTVGKFYYITDDKINNTITNQIYNDLMPVASSLKDIVLSDYFTDELVNNFDFSYVKQPNYGTISQAIDATTKSITWTIGELKPGETAIVQYKFKLKDKYSSDILNKVINTHKKMELTYTNSDNKKDTKSTTETPQIKLVKEILPDALPATGSSVFTGIAIVAISVLVICGIRYFMIKKDLDNK